VHNNLAPEWTAFDGSQLRAAREKAGVDIFSYSRKVNLSTAQVLELEEGGNSYFYTPSIKFNAGKKLLSSFAIKTEYERLSEEDKTKPQQDKAVAESFLEEPTQAEQTAKKVRHSIANKSLLILTAIVAIGIVYAFVTYPSKFNKSPDNSRLLVSSNVSNAEKSAVLVPAEISIKAEVVSAQENSAPIATQLLKNEPIQTECIWSENPHNLSATRATKDSNYVYLIATKEVFVCIKDNTNKVSIVNIKANEPKNIAGVSPLTLQSKDLNSLNIFYQGRKIQLPSNTINEVKLVAIPIQ
jgi:hypothetical protein